MLSVPNNKINKSKIIPPPTKTVIADLFTINYATAILLGALRIQHISFSQWYHDPHSSDGTQAQKG